jgi:hypothetical protein
MVCVATFSQCQNRAILAAKQFVQMIATPFNICSKYVQLPQISRALLQKSGDSGAVTFLKSETP